MLAVTRKSEIKDIVLEKKSVTVTELAKIFSVTEETIRRDLKQLESEGFLTRTYGGAFIQDGVENNIDLTGHRLPLPGADPQRRLHLSRFFHHHPDHRQGHKRHAPDCGDQLPDDHQRAV